MYFQVTSALVRRLDEREQIGRLTQRRWCHVRGMGADYLTQSL